MGWSSKTADIDDDTPAGSSFRIASYDVDQDKPRPIALLVNVYDSVSETEGGGEGTAHIPSRQIELPAQHLGDGYVGEFGRLVIRYGVGACTRQLIADLRSGTYQLPPCEFATVDVIASSLDRISVSAAMAEGWVPQPARLTHTFLMNLGIGYAGALAYPDGARWVTIMTSAQQTGAGNPHFLFYAGTSGGNVAPLIRQDFATEEFFPPSPGPHELAPMMGDARWGYSNEGAGAIKVAVRFYLET